VLKRISLVAAVLALALTSVAFAWGHDDDEFAWQDTPTGSTSSLRGLSAVNAKTVWASGSLGTVLRTVDRGQTWAQVGPPGTEALQFRDIEAFDRNHAVILSIPSPTATDSRVYVTSDAGAHWQLAFQNDDPNAFYDCMTFFDRRHGLALSDPVHGAFRIIATEDGGHSWRMLDADMPPALPNEFAFAASGQCLTSFGNRDAWFGTGGAAARVFHSSDRGRSWDVSSTPMHSDDTAGIFALAFRNREDGLAVGGDVETPEASPDALALSRDGGDSWNLISDAPNQYRSGASWLNKRTAIAVGLTGSDVSLNAGRNWTPFDTGSLHTVDCVHVTCWASGANGRVAYLITDDD
jgi:photosystem II stability/assembly factor-like uncharacterized protein